MFNPSASDKILLYLEEVEPVENNEVVEEVKPVENNEVVDEVKPAENNEVVEKEFTVKKQMKENMRRK